MANDPTYSPGVSRKLGGNILTIGAQGKVTISNASPALSTSALNANVTSATVTGNDTAGSVSIVSTGTAPAANQTLFTVTFANAHANAPLVFPVNSSPGAGSASTYSGSYGVTSTAAGFTVQNLSALTNSSTVTMGYLVIGVE